MKFLKNIHYKRGNEMNQQFANHPTRQTNKQQYKINLINMPMESGSFAQTHKIIEKMN